MSNHFDHTTSSEEVCSTFADQIKGKTFVITGTSAKGLGAKYATVLAKHAPRQLILVSRSQAKVDPVIEEIRSTDPNVTVKFVPCELSDQDSVRAAAKTILADDGIPKIDVLINNAGVMALERYTVDKHGVELQLSSNHVGHFLLTNLLLPKILSSAGARIVNLTSLGHRLGPFRHDDPNFGDGAAYDPWSAYGQSKTANVLFTVELARRLGDQVSAFAVHPGLIVTTGLGVHVDLANLAADTAAAAEKNNPGIPWSVEGQAMKSDSQGAASALVAALRPDLAARSPAYMEDCQVAEPLPYAVDAEGARKLWAWSEEVVGQKFDY